VPRRPRIGNARILAAKGIDDPMLAGCISPTLEHYRAARAAQEEIHLEEMREATKPADARCPPIPHPPAAKPLRPSCV
jgi:hypothetical protein